jgi:hypothetical protein
MEVSFHPYEEINGAVFSFTTTIRAGHPFTVLTVYSNKNPPAATGGLSSFFEHSWLHPNSGITGILFGQDTTVLSRKD